MGLNRYISALFASIALLLLTLSCVKDRGIKDVHDNDPDEICTQPVLFSSGNTGNNLVKAASPYPGSPYMEQDGRFVCTMYYKSGKDATESSRFDLDEGVLSWLSVNNGYGNSVYRMPDFRPITKTDEEAYTEYGFDPDAEFFYWKNRLSHVFVGYADYNQLKTNSWNSGWALDEEVQPAHAGALFMYPYHNGNKQSESQEWFLNLYNTIQITYPDPDPESPDTPVTPVFSIVKSNYAPPWHISSSVSVQDSEWYQTYGELLPESIREELLRNRITDATLDPDGHYYKRNVWHIDTEGQPYCLVYRQETVYINSPANVLDLRRPAEESVTIADQPDPILAVTKMQPKGSSQEANRVELFFKHQFAQVQVNIRKGTDGSFSDLDAANITNVELLGVSEHGYVFTRITDNGDAMPADYEPVNLKNYTQEQLRNNPYGTSFAMFPMASSQTPSTAIKSFNAIAFGYLRALRITWQESEGGIEHVATMLVDKDEHDVDLQQLRSGVKYIYDIELQRGTVAFLRVHLVDWILDDEHQFIGDGTVDDDTPAQE